MKLGFIGTGIITTSVVTGFCESGMENLQIVVSPRNKERAQMLHEKYPEIVSVAADNQEVVDRSDWVFAALLPKAAEDILKTASYRTGEEVYQSGCNAELKAHRGNVWIERDSGGCCASDFRGEPLRTGGDLPGYPGGSRSDESRRQAGSGRYAEADRDP